MQVKMNTKENGPTEVKGPIEVNCKHSDGQNTFRPLRLRTCPLLSHFRNDGTTVEYVATRTSPDRVTLLELKGGERKGVGEGTAAGAR